MNQIKLECPSCHHKGWYEHTGEKRFCQSILHTEPTYYSVPAPELKPYRNQFGNVMLKKPENEKEN